MCLPARAAAITGSAWAVGQVVTVTASTRGILEQFLVAAVGVRDVEVGGCLVRFGRIDIGDRDEVDARVSGQVRQVGGS